MKNAGDGTRTHTILRPQAPEACASANSATPAYLIRSVCLTDAYYNNKSGWKSQQFFLIYMKIYFFVNIRTLGFIYSFRLAASSFSTSPNAHYSLRAGTLSRSAYKG